MVETVLVYLAPIGLLYSPFAYHFLWHCLLQFALFIPLVQLPAFLFSRMSYVDIGWPVGLVVLAVTSILYGTGYWLRRYIVGGCLLLHGGRMALGGLLMFFPYKFAEDLPRYQYAYIRWITKTNMTPSSWAYKIQHDTLQQAFANGIILATPILLCSFNPSPTISIVEVFGWVSWLGCWVMESWADVQKNQYLADCKEQGKKATLEAKEALKVSCLGYGPHAKPSYFLWTWCRHPNYFFEWMCWNSCVIAAIPSLLSLDVSAWVRAALGINLFLVSRLFYDCLLYWTGSEPSEYFSVSKRLVYRKYQESTNAFFPHHLNFVTSLFFDHHRDGFSPLPTQKSE